MKPLLKYALKNYLRFFSKLAVMVHKPCIIAVAGSTNKSFHKEAISKRLRLAGFNVRSNIKSYNTDIGLSLAILSLPSGYGNYRNWLPALRMAPAAAFKKGFPRILVLELGISDPRDMDFLTSIIKPDIVVITNITQRYLESFSDMDELVSEFKCLISNTKSDGAIILNADNPRLEQLDGTAKARSFTFGITNDSAYCKALEVKKNSLRQELKIRLGENLTEESTDRPGQHHIYALLSAMIAEKIVKEKLS